MANKKKGVNGKQKGNSFELKMCKAFQAWTGEEFNRTPGSGSYHSRTKMDNMEGDITCKNPKFKLSLEMKKREGFHLEHLISNEKCPIWDWWNQTVSQATEDKIPVLIFSKNRTPVYVMSRQCLVHTPDIVVMNVNSFKLKESVYIYQLSDLFKENPKNFFHD